MLDRRRISILHLQAVSTHIDAPVFGIAQDDAVARADVSTSIQFVPAWYWKLEEIDFLPPKLVFQNRAARDTNRRHWSIFLEALFPANHDFVGILGADSQCKKRSLVRGAEITDDSILPRVFGDIFEQKRRPLAFERQLRQNAQLQVPVSTRDMRDLAFLFKRCQEIPQILKRHKIVSSP